MKNILVKINGALLHLLGLVIYLPAIILMGIALLVFYADKREWAIKINNTAKRYIVRVGKTFGLI